jgi:hypothetical protein
LCKDPRAYRLAGTICLWLVFIVAPVVAAPASVSGNSAAAPAIVASPSVPGNDAASPVAPAPPGIPENAATVGPTDATTRSAPNTRVASYWGMLPEPSDSVTARFQNLGKPLWEQTLLVPYRVIAVPFRCLASGAGVMYIYLDDHRYIRRLGRLIRPRQRHFGFTLNATAGGSEGWGGGFTLMHDAFLAPGNRAKLRVQATTDGSRRASFGFARGQRDRDVTNELGFGYRLDPAALYFGTGPWSRPEDKSYYKQEAGWAAAGHTLRWGRAFALEGRAIASSIGARETTGKKTPPLGDTFVGRIPPGYGRRSDAFSWSVALRHDTTHEDGRPVASGLRRLSVARTDEFDGEGNSFWTFRADAAQYVPLWNSGQSLAVRGFISWSEPIGGSVIPFQRMMVNDEPDLLRGYWDLRFRDRAMTALSAEYRWPVWAQDTAQGTGVDAYLLGDVGQVFGEPEQLAMEQLTVSYGGGLRFISPGGFVGRVELAWSEEGLRARLRADQIFQFAKGGLYHGRNPVPLR